MMAPTIEENVDTTTLSLDNLDIEKATSLNDLLGLSPVKNDVERLNSVKTLQVIFIFPFASLRNSAISNLSIQLPMFGVSVLRINNCLFA